MDIIAFKNYFYIWEKKEKRRLDPKCWKGYRKKGTKMKGGIRVNKCVKVSENYAYIVDEFDNILKKAGYPKFNYNPQEVFKLIAEYEEQVDPRDRDKSFYNSIAKALEDNNIDRGLVSDYLDSKRYQPDEEI